MLIVGVVAAVCFSHCVTSSAPAEVKVRPREDVTLECRGPRDAEITLLEWTRRELESGDYVFFYRNRRPYEKYQHESFKGRVELRDPSMKDGDVAVILRNVSISDAGTYDCLARTRTSSEVKQSIRLTVTASASGLVEKSTKDGGDTSGFLAVGVPVAVLFLVPVVVLGVVMFRKLRKKCANVLKSQLKPSPCEMNDVPADTHTDQDISE